METLNEKDYKEILKYYKKDIPSNFEILKENAEKLLNERLCRCINNLQQKQKKNTSKNSHFFLKNKSKKRKIV
jgi:hypothetical protein